MDLEQASAKDQINALASIDHIKVWSLIATIFGDLTKGDMTSLSGRQIRQIADPMGIKHEALRVALHRLRKDRWIETRKSGRETLYKLTPDAMRETVRVHDDVYRGGQKYQNDWWLQVRPEDGEIGSVGFEISRNAFLVPSQLLDSDEQVIATPVELANLPAWVDGKIVPASSITAAELLLATLRQSDAAQGPASDFDKAVMRILVVHHWRKLALRESTWFHIARHPAGSIAQCQEVVSSLFEGLRPLQAEFFDLKT